MAEMTQTHEATEPQVGKSNRFKRFLSNHPRTTKVVGTIAGVATVVTVVGAVKNARDNDSNLANSASDGQSPANDNPADANV